MKVKYLLPPILVVACIVVGALLVVRFSPNAREEYKQAQLELSVLKTTNEELSAKVQETSRLPEVVAYVEVLDWLVEVFREYSGRPLFGTQVMNTNAEGVVRTKAERLGDPVLEAMLEEAPVAGIIDYVIGKLESLLGSEIRTLDPDAYVDGRG